MGELSFKILRVTQADPSSSRWWHLGLGQERCLRAEENGGVGVLLRVFLTAVCIRDWVCSHSKDGETETPGDKATHLRHAADSSSRARV